MNYSNLVRLLIELHRQGFTLKTIDGLLAVKPKDKLTGDLRKGIRHHKIQLLEILTPCRHCGTKLTVHIAPTWFQVRCPSEPIHFLIEEHEHSYGETLKAERGFAA